MTEKRSLHKQYLILFFSRFQKQKNLTDYDAMVLSLKQFKKNEKKNNNKNNGTDVLKKNSGQFCSVMQNSLFFLKEKYNFPAVSPFKIKIYHYL